MKRLLSTCLALGVLAAPAGAPLRAQAHDDLALPLRLTAFAVNMSNVGTGSAGLVEIRITRWSTPDERQRVIDTMVEKGQDALLKLLQDLPEKGRLRLPNRMGP